MTQVEILAGSGSIGGNFVRIEEKDKVLVFDQGIRFDVMANYYSSYITPRGIAELRDLGVLPKANWYENVDCIYISHMHLDHLGALSNIPFETELLLPNLSIYNAMEERWRSSPTWLSLIPRKYYLKVEEIRPCEVDKNDVIAIPVSHSAWPAYAFLYFGADRTILYTGDFRDESFLSEDEFFDLNGGADLLTYFEENSDIRVDTLIIEGTNIGSSRPPITPDDTIKILKKLFSSHKSIIATLHGLDLEYAHTLIKLSEEFNLNCYLASHQIVKLIEKIPELPEVMVIDDYLDELVSFERVLLDDIHPNSLILVSYREVIDLLRDLSSLDLTEDLVAILSEPEPEKEEGFEYGIISNWFSKFGLQYYRIRASGHYYPYALKSILQKIRPKDITPIHSENPRLLVSLAKRSQS